MKEPPENQREFLIEEAIESQRKHFRSGHTRSIDYRIRQLVTLRRAIIEKEADILEALHKDLGRCEFEGYASEVGIVIGEIDFMIKNIRRFAKTERVRTPRLFFGAKSYIIPEPLGVTLIIGPWNYPFQLIVMPLIGTIAAGNCAVIKPSELAPNISEIVCRMIKDNFPEEYITVFQGGVETSNELLKYKFEHIFFTGGTAIGKIVMEAAAKHLTPVTLELGGKSPCIVDAEVNLKNTARRITWGKFLNAGQTCVAPDYVLVHRRIKEELIGHMIETIEAFYGANPAASPYYSRIINERHFNRIFSLLQDGNIVYGGKAVKDKLYISPTIMDAILLDRPIMQEEIFGPVLPVITYDALDEAIQLIHSKPKPLALYVFSTNKRNIGKVLVQTSSGGVSVNDTISHITTPYMPFGGTGESGLGSYHGKASFDTFTHRRSVLHNQLAFDLKAKYPPYNIPLGTFKHVLKFLLR